MVLPSCDVKCILHHINLFMTSLCLCMFSCYYITHHYYIYIYQGYLSSKTSINVVCISYKFGANNKLNTTLVSFFFHSCFQTLSSTLVCRFWRGEGRKGAVGMKACSAETVGCQSIWEEMESAPVVTNILHFCLRPL